MTRIPRDDLLDALSALADRVGGTPTRAQMDESGRYSHQPYYTEFGSWNDALRAAGFDPNHENDVAEADLITALQRLDEEVDGTPTFEDMAEHGAFDPSTYYAHFGSWPDAKAAAGLDPATTTSRRIPDEELLGDLRRLEAELGRAPRQADVREYGDYSVRPYYRQWDSWDGMLDAAGLDIDRNPGASREDLLAELRRLADERGQVPRFDGMNEHGRYSVWPYLRVFDSWNDALRAAGFSINKAHGVVSGHLDYGANWAEQRERALRRDEWKCQECGLTMGAHRCIWDGEGLHVHHVEKLRAFDSTEAANRLENLRTLCRRCHHRVE
ncbi:hypothetical protein BRD13_02840 [Halobacteriales archaeon SW_5_70_135]|nr:MAG: hypothetical protein BRD13_02840 [Halobacteriales archaeon SW_5_70_135]